MLVAEDEAIPGLYLKAMIEQMGHKVVAVVGRGVLAIKAAKEYRVDLMLFDIRLKDDVDGIEAAEIIDSGIPVVFYSAFTDQSTVDRAHRLNPVAMIEKPAHDTVLRAAITKGLSSRPYAAG